MSSTHLLVFLELRELLGSTVPRHLEGLGFSSIPSRCLSREDWWWAGRQLAVLLQRRLSCLVTRCNLVQLILTGVVVHHKLDRKDVI